MRFRRPELIPVLFIIASVLLLGGLGIWQVERLQWKNALIAGIAQAQSQPALGSLPQDVSALDYRNVSLSGTFSYDKTMRMVGHPQGEGPGFYLVTPFTLDDDGRIILINRGFAPEGKEVKPEGIQTVNGIIRPARPKRLLAPENRPDRNVWFHEDLPAMAGYSGLPLTPIVVEAVGPQTRGLYPLPSDGQISLLNDHLGYAITWFSLMVIALVMFAAYHREYP